MTIEERKELGEKVLSWFVQNFLLMGMLATCLTELCIFVVEPPSELKRSSNVDYILWLHVFYMLWFVIYLFISNLRNELAKAESRVEDGKVYFDVIQFIVVLSAVYSWRLFPKGSDIPLVLYVNFGAIFLICVISYVQFITDRQHFVWLRGIGAVFAQGGMTLSIYSKVGVFGEQINFNGMTACLIVLFFVLLIFSGSVFNEIRKGTYD